MTSALETPTSMSEVLQSGFRTGFTRAGPFCPVPGLGDSDGNAQESDRLRAWGAFCFYLKPESLPGQVRTRWVPQRPRTHGVYSHLNLLNLSAVLALVLYGLSQSSVTTEGLSYLNLHNHLKGSAPVAGRQETKAPHCLTKNPR